MTTLSIPMSPEALTAEWLTDALHTCGALDYGAVVSWQAERIGEGEGVMSQMVRLRPDYDHDDASAPHTLIAKFPTEALDRFVVAKLLRLYSRETGFYAELQHIVPLRTPRCYFNIIDPTTEEFVLLLEDLAPAIGGDQVSGSSTAKVQMGLDAVAGMHAALWQHPLLDDLEWMPAWNDPLLAPFFVESYRNAWRAFRKSLPASIPADIVPIGDRLVDGLRHLLEQLAQPPRTLLHGDYRLDNIFFSPDRADSSVAVIDWQACARGRGLFDVAYLMSQSLTPADRKTDEMRLLGRYYRLLLAGGVTGYSFADCLLDYRRAVMLGLVYPIVAAHSMGRNQGRGEALARTMVERGLAAVLDLDCAKLL